MPLKTIPYAKGNFGNISIRHDNSDYSQAITICQICFKPNHTADAYWNMFNDNFVPTPPRHFGRSKGVKSAYMAKYNSGFNFRGLMFDYAVKDNSRSLMVVIPIRLDLPSYQIHHIFLELCLDLELELELLLLQILKELLMMHGILIVVLLTTLPTWLINMQIREEFRG